MRVIGCLKAGDFCASQTRSLCLMLPLAIRDGGNAKVSPYAIGWGRANASRGASRHYSAPGCGKPAFLSSTRMHPASPRQCQKPRNSSRKSSPRSQGKKESLPTGLYFLLKPGIRSLVAFPSHVVWASRLIDGLQVQRHSRPCLPAVIDSR